MMGKGWGSRFVSSIVLAASPLGWHSNHPLFCTGSAANIIRNNVRADLPLKRLGPGNFTGRTNVELTFVGSVGGSLDANAFQSSENSALQDLVQAVEDLLSSTINHQEANRVALALDARPHVEIVTDVDCPGTLSYAEEDTACLHFVIEVPLLLTNGPEEYIVKDEMKRRLYKATDLDGSLYDALEDVNANTVFIGIGKPGAGES